MSGDEARLLSLFRSTDNRGREHILVIAEAEAKYAAEGLQEADRATLESQTHNLPMKHENDQIEGRNDKIEGEETSFR